MADHREGWSGTPRRAEPRTTSTAGHGGGLERHNRIELTLADHHAARVLAEVARQIERGAVEVEEFGDLGIFELKSISSSDGATGGLSDGL